MLATMTTGASTGWILLSAAIAIEIIATSFLRTTHGFTRLVPTVVCLAGYGASLYLLSLALRTLQVGVAYAVWSGVGTAVIATVGIVFLGEPLTWFKVGGIALVIGGVVLLNLGPAR